MMDDFTQQYIATALWMSGKRKLEQLAAITVQQIGADCRRFQHVADDLLTRVYAQFNYTQERAGHDFWMTRNGSTGFVNLGHNSRHLVKLATIFGPFELRFDTKDSHDDLTI